MDQALRDSLWRSRSIGRALALESSDLITAALHCEGWLRREGHLTPNAYRVIDEHVWQLVDAAGAAETPQPCGWNWDAIEASSRGSRQMMAQYLRAALRHHTVWAARDRAQN